MKNIEIKFSTEGNVFQMIKLYHDISPKQFIDRLKSGRYLTTIGYDDGVSSKIYDIKNYSSVGEIIAQESFDDTEINNFELIHY